MLYSSHQFEIDSVSSHSFKITFFRADLLAGDYELLVNVRDESANASLQPYRIRFHIRDAEKKAMVVICSPNPSSSYIHLETKIHDYLNIKSLTYVIYNLKGVVIEEEVTITNSDVHNWYWYPNPSVSGLYVYKVIRTNKDASSAEHVTGKFVILQ
jgi:hypothetical protein